MAKKIRFALSLADGTQARSLDELKEHFDLESVVGHYKSGKLLTWLRDRYIETEADAVEALDENAPDFQQKLCEVFGAQFDGNGADMEEIARRQERLGKLRQFTDEDEFIQNIDAVAFDQEELADLLDEGCETIYLCGDKFTVPASVQNKVYVGVNSPVVHISGKIDDDWESRNIDFSGCEVDRLKAETKETAVLGNPDSCDVAETIPAEVADKIYWRTNSPIHKHGYIHHYIETQDYVFLYDNMSAISKKSGKEFVIAEESKMPSVSCHWDKSAVHHNTIFALFGDGDVYKIDIEEPSITSLNFRASDGYTQLATNGQYLVFAHHCKPVCVDLENRKKYVLENKVYCDKSPIVCTKDAIYFVSHNLDDSGKAVDLIEFSLADKIERVVTKIQANSYDAAAISFYKHKIFLMFVTDLGTVLGFVDLSSNVPEFIYVEPDEDEYTDGYHIYIYDEIYKYDRGWFFVSQKKGYPIEKFDFETMTFTTIAEGCGYTERCSSGLFGCGPGYNSYTPNKIFKIGQWLYFRQGEKGDAVRVSLDQPMQIEPLHEEMTGVDL